MFSLMPRKRERGTVPTFPRKEFAPFDVFRREFASLFDRAFPTWPIMFETPWTVNEPWGLELEKKEGEYVVTVPVPGFEPNEIDVTLRNNILVIQAEHKEKPEKPGAERPPVKWEQELALPEGFEPDKVEAHYHNGILEVHFPLPPEVKPRRIEVKVGT
jgi:HSP20 family protein